MVFTQFLSEFPIGCVHLNSFNYWVENIIEHNISDREIKLSDGKRVMFSNVRLDSPKYIEGSNILDMTPQFARQNSLTYSGDIYVDATLLSEDSEILEQEKNINIGTIPIMLKSKKCHLYGKSTVQLSQMGENPHDFGCYFIVNGQEKNIPLQEKSSLNMYFCTKIGSSTIKEKNSKMMVNVENKKTTMIKLIYGLKTELFSIYTPSINGHKDEEMKIFNVLHLFNLLGMKTIEAITKLIMCFITTDESKRNMAISLLSNNIIDYSKSDSMEEFRILVNKVKYKKTDIEAEVVKMLNNDIFPHLNNYPSYQELTQEEKMEEINLRKAYLLAIMLANFLECVSGSRKFSDRDSWSNKRLEGGGAQHGKFAKRVLEKDDLYCRSVYEKHQDFFSVLHSGKAQKERSNHRQLHFILHHPKLGSQRRDSHVHRRSTDPEQRQQTGNYFSFNDRKCQRQQARQADATAPRSKFTVWIH